MIFIALGILSLVSQVQNLESPIRMTLAGENGIDESITAENFLFSPGASRLSISGDFRSTASVKMRGCEADFRSCFVQADVWNAVKCLQCV